MSIVKCKNRRNNMGVHVALCVTIFCLTLASGQTYTHLQDGFRVGNIEAPQRQAMPENRPGPLGKFSWKNCGHPGEDIFNLTGLSVSPDPVQTPGVVKLSAGFKLKEVIDSPFKLEVEFYKKLRSGGWLKIPCIAQVGSCTYDDMCNVLAHIPVCPKELVAAGIPCKCPFQKGAYKLPPTTFTIPIPLLPTGDYRVKAAYTAAGDKPGGCLEIFISFD